MKIDKQNRIHYGAGRVQEAKEWNKRFPLGPVHWDVWNHHKEKIGTDIRADELQNFMVAKELLVLW